MGFALGVCEVLLRRLGKSLVITHGTDGAHKPGSLHPFGNAVDIRSHDLTGAQAAQLLKDMKVFLDPAGFDCILEPDHFHIEFQPKPGESFTREIPS